MSRVSSSFQADITSLLASVSSPTTIQLGQEAKADHEKYIVIVEGVSWRRRALKERGDKGETRPLPLQLRFVERNCL